jgi:hypothetical protein
MSPAPVLADLTQTITDTVGVMQSAEVFIDGFAARQAAAIQAALDLGASATELAPLTALNTALASEKTKLATAIATTPAA